LSSIPEWIESFPERIEPLSASALLTFWVEWVLPVVVLLSLLFVRQHFLGCGDINEFLLRRLLLLLVLEVNSTIRGTMLNKNITN
jgi:hypothetical protein